MIDEVYRNNIIIVLGDLYQLSICSSNFVDNNSHFKNISQQTMHLMYVNILCVKDWNQVLRTSSV